MVDFNTLVGAQADPAAADQSAATQEAKPTVVDKLRALKAAAAGDTEFVLDVTGVKVSMPKFVPYAAWQRAQRFGGSNQDVVQTAFITAVSTFDGERLTLEDYAEFIPAMDHLQIVGTLFGGKAKNDPAGAAGK